MNDDSGSVSEKAASRFIDKLKELGYADHNLRPSDLEFWFFNRNERIRAFLDWFVHAVYQESSLATGFTSPRHREIVDELESQGKILRGTELLKVFKATGADKIVKKRVRPDTNEADEENLRQAKQRQIEQLSKRKQVLLNVKSNLRETFHHNNTSHQKSLQVINKTLERVARHYSRKDLPWQVFSQDPPDENLPIENEQQLQQSLMDQEVDILQQISTKLSELGVIFGTKRNHEATSIRKRWPIQDDFHMPREYHQARVQLEKDIQEFRRECMAQTARTDRVHAQLWSLEQGTSSVVSKAKENISKFEKLQVAASERPEFRGSFVEFFHQHSKHNENT